MRNYRFTTWFLLGYLALLLNVGPSAHHAEFFGFHSHGDSGHVHVHVDLTGLGIAGDCSCSHKHSVLHTQLINRDSALAIKSDSSCGDCLLCHYFDHFHGICAALKLDLAKSYLCEPLVAGDAVLFARTIVRSARGPPVILLS